MALSNEECNLGQIDLEAVLNEVEKATESKKKRGAYFVYSSEERLNIAKYAVENGTSRAVHISKGNILRRTKALSVRSRLNANEKRKQQGLKKDKHYKKICSQPQGRPTMLRLTDEMVQSYLKVCILYIISFFILKMHDRVGRF